VKRGWGNDARKTVRDCQKGGTGKKAPNIGKLRKRTNWDVPFAGKQLGKSWGRSKTDYSGKRLGGKGRGPIGKKIKKPKGGAMGKGAKKNQVG